MTIHSIIIELIVESEIFFGSNFFIKTNWRKIIWIN